MSPSPAPALAPRARPVEAGERLVILDVLRGFALGGVFQRPRKQKVLGVLAPAGRMALTNYLAQTAVNPGLYSGDGLGLLGQVGPAACLGLMAALFAVQVLVSHL